MTTTETAALGLVIIGSEILDGRRTDSHFVYARDLLKVRGFTLAYTLIIPDEPALIEDKLRWCFARPEPFFCCGGIGGTPDDYTRDCAARAVGVGLEHHAEGVQILERRWGKAISPIRLRLVEFPAGATLIPNPVNQVPGFTIQRGHFVPGFPEMAQPMMAWVLDTCYVPASPRERRTVLLPTAREGDLTPIMEQVLARHPGLSLSSLPRFTPTGTEVELSLHGEPAQVTEAFYLLCRLLDKGGFAYINRQTA